MPPCIGSRSNAPFKPVYATFVAGCRCGSHRAGRPAERGRRVCVWAFRFAKIRGGKQTLSPGSLSAQTMRSETGGDDRELVARSILAILCQGPRSCAYLDRQGVDDRTTPAQAHQIQSRGARRVTSSIRNSAFRSPFKSATLSLPPSSRRSSSSGRCAAIS